MGFTSFRELTRAELRDVRRLASDMCANYDRDYGCLLLDGKCYMHYGAAYTNSALCKYFRNAVLPLEPRLEAVFRGENVAEYIRRCVICGKELFAVGNRAKYCRLCARRVHRRQKNESDRKRRSRTDKWGLKKSVISRAEKRVSEGLNGFIPEPLKTASICPHNSKME